MADENNTERKAPPRDNLVRGALPVELREDGGDGRTLYGHFAVFDQWTHIRSTWEGEFMERIAPGAFKKTIQENRNGLRVLFQHGQDPQIGSKPIASLRDIGEDATGAYYEAELLDGASYVRDLMPGLRAGVYGASFQFNVLREDWNDEPGVSDHNPTGLPERTLSEVRLHEMGPVTWGAYPEATSGVRSEMRSLTDEFRAGREAPGPDGQASATATSTNGVIGANMTTVTFTAAASDEARQADADETTETPTAEAAPPPADVQEDERAVAPSTDDAPETTTPKEGINVSIDEMRARQDEIKSDLAELGAEYTGQRWDDAARSRWDSLNKEFDELEEICNEQIARDNRLAELSGRGGHTESVGQASKDAGTGIPVRTDGSTYVTKRAGRDGLPDNIFDVASYRARAQSPDQEQRMMRDGARAAIETFHYTGAPHVARDAVNTHIEGLINEIPAEMSQRILIHGSSLYRSAFWKHMQGRPMSRDEQSALTQGIEFEKRALTTGDTGGVTVPVQIDPTVLPSSNGSLNPFRQISKVVTTSSHQWQAVTAADVTATYRAQAATMADNSPTLIAPAIIPERADIMFPFAWEAADDWGGLERDLGMLIQRAKDNVEATKFAVGAGHGSTEPLGVLIGAGTLVGTNATVSIGTSDIYTLFNSLGPSFQGNATWVAHQSVLSRFRTLATATGPGMWAESLVVGNPATLLSRPAYAASSVGTAGGASTPTASVKYAIVGDFSYFAIVDRIGMQLKYIDNLFAGNTAGGLAYPTGQSGLVAYWRNSSGVLASNAFRTGTVT